MTREDERAVSLTRFRPADLDEDGATWEDAADDDAVRIGRTPAPDGAEEGLRWLCAFNPPETDPKVLPISTALPGYLKEALKAVGTATGCDVLTFTAIAGLHRGLEWVELQPEIGRLRRARRLVLTHGWPTDALDWGYTLRGCGQRDHIELRRVGSEHASRLHQLKDVLGLSLRVTAGLCVLFGVEDLNLRGAPGRQASEQARDFLAQLEGRVVLAEDLSRRAARDPAGITSVSRDELRSRRR